MSSSKGDDVVLTDRELKLLGRYEGSRYVILLLMPILCAVIGSLYLWVTARIAQRMDADLPGVIQAWLKKGPSYQESYRGFLVAAFDKLEGAILFYSLSLLYSLWVLWPARQDRRLFRKLKLLYERTKSG